MDEESDLPFLRIGELSKRVGVSEHLLRAWELRYGLMDPARSDGGYRLYTSADERRVRTMLSYLSKGLAAAQAAQAAKTETGAGALPTVEIQDLKRGYNLLRQSLDQLDEPSTQAILDGFFLSYPVEEVLREIVLHYLQEMGSRWAAQNLSVAQEHFASNIFRGRLSILAKGWGEGDGPSALLACPPGEEHEFGLLISGIMLHRSGWKISYLGKNTPMPDILEVAAQMRPTVVLLTSTASERFTTVISELRRISKLSLLILSGAGATREIAEQCDAKLVEGDPVAAPEQCARVMESRS